MAKKNLASLMSGIIGETPVEDSSRIEIPIQEEKKRHLEELRHKNAGRPCKSEVRKQLNETRATFIIPTDILWKVKYIGLIDGLLMKDIIGSALGQYIAKWEKDNGPIKTPR